jgi:hypothetical protein
MKKKTVYLDLIQTVAIVFGIVFGLLELSQMRAERSRHAALELARSSQTPGLIEGVTTTPRMPDGASGPGVEWRFTSYAGSILRGRGGDESQRRPPEKAAHNRRT